ncbi:shikimate kinase [Halobacillus litoralis]|uniref:shikimate kinase n=1 Tax=Halobacillus litoralis TaxID=45668 RepID=UPI001CFCAD24|nr:shikimate kinase [Halobacillus litoralis]WLR46285.1 shikimate kinase [Halobacillus litoralis]
MIFLTGFMGSGKSTIAKMVSEKMKYPYIEMDEAIEEAEGMKIRDMFALKGENYFRNKETEFLSNLKEEVVVSTGGGVILREENRTLMQEGTVVYLKAEWETIVERLTGDTDRPLWKGDDSEKKKRFDERLNLYEQAADVVINVDQKTPEEITEEVVARLK